MKQIYRYNFIGYKLENRAMKKVEDSVVHEAVEPMLGIVNAKNIIRNQFDIPMCDINILTIEDVATSEVFEYATYTVLPIVQHVEQEKIEEINGMLKNIDDNLKIGSYGYNNNALKEVSVNFPLKGNKQIVKKLKELGWQCKRRKYNGYIMCQIMTLSLQQ